ncbi:plasmid mobilization protein [Variovorax gossypii]|uniref:Plasmid mobilization protein n=1 Tax=Variovorax gossypii TaxID=1679495 RepID=A0A3S0GXM6_9BURK|nr:MULTISPECIES: MobA/MobL family protein [Variovorax]MDR6522154.1 hypothetical protein [Variovorax paradoxus]RTQ35547.1 plasmid mobilization protein [Variovorax gossypii]
MATFYFDIKSGGKGSARRHSKYISRVGHYADREDLVARGFGNLPEWADGTPELFWAVADRHERSNGAIYRETIVALPNELSTEQNVELAWSYARECAGNKPFEFAVHRPLAALGGVPQPHVHLMISDRVPDGIIRSPEKHFRRYNSAQPERGGCRKDSGGKTRSELAAELKGKREHWAETVNAMLEHYGHDARVDHRTRTERGLASSTERHLGPAGVRALDAEGKKGLIAARER